MVEMSQKECQTRVALIQYEITEADKILQDARLALRSSFKQKQKLVELLKEAQTETD